MIRLSTLVVGSAMLLAACESGPERRGGPDRPPADPSARQGLLTASPIGLVLVGFDTNFDQIVTRTEMETGLQTLFPAADRNDSSGLDQSELRAFFISHLGSEYPVPGRLAFDPNGNQLVDSSEFAAVFDAAFTRMDTNGDGQLIRSEMLRQINMATGRQRGRGGRGGSGGRGGGGPRG